MEWRLKTTRLRSCPVPPPLPPLAEAEAAQEDGTHVSSFQTFFPLGQAQWGQELAHFTHFQRAGL